MRLGAHPGPHRPSSPWGLVAVLVLGLLAYVLYREASPGGLPFQVSTGPATPLTDASLPTPSPVVSTPSPAPATPAPAPSPPPSQSPTPAPPPAPPRRLSPRATASSHEPPHAPSLLVDGSTSTYWHSGEEHHADWLRLSLPRPMEITRIGLVPGRVDAGDAIFRGNNRVKTVRLEFPDGTRQVMRLQDAPRMQYLALDPPVEASWVRLVVSEVYPGQSWHHGIVPEVELWGRPAPDP